MAPTPRKPFNDEGLKAYDPLQSVIHTDRAGGRYDFDTSLRYVIESMEHTLDDINEGEWNGMPIKDPGNVPEYLQLALKPVMETALKVMQAVNINSGFTNSLQIDFEDRAKFEGSTEIDLNAADNAIVEGVNKWLRYVHENGYAKTMGLPLAINDKARKDPLEGIRRVSDVLTLESGSGWKVKSFITNDEAAERMYNADQPMLEARRAQQSKI